MGTSGGSGGGGATPFPNYAGSGSPNGVVTAAAGKSYVDTAAGILYFKFEGAGNTGWAPVTPAGAPFAIGVANFSTDGIDYPWMKFATEKIALAWGQAGDTFPRACFLSDTTDGFYFGDGTYDPYTTAGAPTMFVIGKGWQVTAGGANSSSIAVRDNTSPGVVIQAGASEMLISNSGISYITPITHINSPITTAPTDSHTAIGAFGQVAIGTPKQNITGYDILVHGNITVTAATAGVINLGVGPTSTPTVDPITAAFSTAALEIVGFTAIVPDQYYLSLTTSGTITVGTPVSVATPL